ncbi:MAG TPA: alpha/beta hydrolase [Actinomycetota bacterium]
MSGIRRLLVGSAGVVAGFASGKVLVRRRDRQVGLVLASHEEELLGSARGRPRIVRGPRSSRVYTEWFPAGTGEAPPGTRDPARGTRDAAAGTVLFTHGWCVTEAIWHYQKGALAGGPYSMVTWDLPGHGHSTPVSRDHLTIDVAVDALARVVDSIEDPNLVLVGHSLGGILTIGYLLRHSETARRRVRGAILAATPLVHFARTAAGRWPGASLQARMLGQVMQLAVENSVVDRYFSREAGSFDPTAASFRLIRTGFGADPDPRHVRFVRDMAATVAPSVRADTFRAMTGFDLRPRLAEIETPTTLVIGDRDRLVSAEESRALGRLIPKATLEEFAGAGHALFLEQHDRFSELVDGFARERLRPSRRRTRSGIDPASPEARRNGRAPANGGGPAASGVAGMAARGGGPLE